MPLDLSLSDGAVERTALTTQVYERLLERISSQHFAPDQRLSIDQLARDLRVSATPVREALARLSSQRLVHFEPYKGYSVRPAMDASRLGQLFETRTIVEVGAVPSGIARVDATHITALHEIVDAMSALSPGPAPHDISAFNDNDRAFHQALIALSGNEFLISLYDTLSPHIHIGRFYYDRGVLAAQRIVDEHRAIVAAYEQRDGTAAVARVRAHLLAAQTRLDEVLSPKDATASAAPVAVAPQDSMKKGG